MAELRNTSNENGQSDGPGPQAPSFGAVIVVMVVLTMVGVFIYAGRSWAAVLLRLPQDGGMAILWLLAAGGWGAALLWLMRLDDKLLPPVLRWTTSAALGLGLMSLVALGLGLIGKLNSAAAWTLLAVGWVIFGLRAAAAFRQSPRALRIALCAPAGWSLLFLLTTPGLSLAIACAFVPPGILWSPAEPHGYDIVEYHLQVPREWFEAGRIAPLEHNVFSYFPFNVEMHYLLAMQLHGGPWAGMYLAQLMHLIFMALTVGAVYGVARAWSAPVLSATLAALAMLTVPWILQLAPIAYDEGGFLLFGTLAVGWLSLGAFGGGAPLRSMAVAGALAGFAAGCKLTAAVEVLAAAAAVAFLIIAIRWAARSEPFGARRLLGFVLFAAMGASTFGPWLVRNVVWARNPVFPEMLDLFGQGDFDGVQAARFEKAHAPLDTQRSAAARFRALNREVISGVFDRGRPGDSASAWQFGYLILPLGVIAFLLSWRRQEAWLLLGLLAALTAFWLSLTHLQSRFFILAAPLCALLIGNINWGRGAWAGAAIIGVFAIIGWVRVSDRLWGILNGSDTEHPGVGSILAQEGDELFTHMMPLDLPPMGRVVMIGEARAFWYPLPMSRLRYRTVFDVKGGSEDMVQAWVGPTPLAPSDHLMINPDEMRRFSNTYYGLPPIPPDVQARRKSYLMTPRTLAPR